MSLVKKWKGNILKAPKGIVSLKILKTIVNLLPDKLRDKVVIDYIWPCYGRVWEIQKLLNPLVIRAFVTLSGLRMDRSELGDVKRGKILLSWLQHNHAFDNIFGASLER